jgi:hypothetical protein
MKFIDDRRSFPLFFIREESTFESLVFGGDESSFRPSSGFVMPMATFPAEEASDGSSSESELGFYCFIFNMTYKLNIFVRIKIKLFS